MKALILCAGLGTRLLPFTRTRPKPLFTVSGQPLVQRLIHALHRAGVDGVVLNVHHLADQFKVHLQETPYPIPVALSVEPSILGTGGAIAANARFMGDAPFFVVNGDILTTIDFASVYAFHMSHNGPATLVLVDDPEFNSVLVTEQGRICAFEGKDPIPPCRAAWKRTFTGIQVLDRTILDYLPETGFSHSIDAYHRMLLEDRPLHAYMPPHAYWKDIGTPERYRDASLDALAAEAFHGVCPQSPVTLQPVKKTRLAGDGSDRTWFRLFRNTTTLVAVDHGIQTVPGATEMKAWIHIGRFLDSKGIPVPAIHAFDFFSGQAVMTDLGNVSLQEYVHNTRNPRDRLAVYKEVIRRLIDFSVTGTRGFDLTWTCQTPFYSPEFILEKECRYFMDAFVRRYLGLHVPSSISLEEEFLRLARLTMEHALFGLMHRDFQSRNIMVFEGQLFFIDFQGARIGPIQYDLASLLIDPYVALPGSVQETLLDFAVNRLARRRTLTPRQFRKGYQYCALCRNLQILGAFAHLSRVKGKRHFEAYIPAAVKTLVRHVAALDDNLFPGLCALTERIAKAAGI